MEKMRIAAYAALTIQLTGCAGGTRGSSATQAPDSLLIRRDIEYLASDKLEGRGTGTPGHDSASAYAARRYAALGLRPLNDGFFQRFTARSAMLAHMGGLQAVQSQNVVAYLPGRDAKLRNQVVVFGAHLDHLGRSAASALDPEAKDAIRNGADDNASGSAAVLELARLIKARPLRRSVLFVNFSGEELGLLGSQYFVDNSPVPVDSIVAMLNFDMVGRMRDNDLMVLGATTAREWTTIIDSANVRVGLRVRAFGDGFGASDHSSFFAKNMPVLHFFTNTHGDYHRATDDADKVNAAGEARIVALAEGIARELDRSDSRLTFVRAAAPPPVAPSAGSQVYLGSIPDMGSPEIKGLKLTGIRAGSPADSGGLKAGDIIVEFGGKPVTDLQTYSDALYSYKPGDIVTVTVMRGSERLNLSVKLGRRGG
jgi:hypothetical protein